VKSKHGGEESARTFFWHWETEEENKRGELQWTAPRMTEKTGRKEGKKGGIRLSAFHERLTVRLSCLTFRKKKAGSRKRQEGEEREGTKWRGRAVLYRGEEGRVHLHTGCDKIVPRSQTEESQ